MTIWNAEQITALLEGYRVGKHFGDLARITGLTAKQCQRKISNLQYYPQADDPGASSAVDERPKRLKEDLAFKQAMLREIKNGTESPFIGTYRAGTSSRYIPVMRGENIAPIGQSVAAQCADAGEKGGWMS